MGLEVAASRPASSCGGSRRPAPPHSLAEQTRWRLTFQRPGYIPVGTRLTLPAGVSDLYVLRAGAPFDLEIQVICDDAATANRVIGAVTSSLRQS